MTRSNSELVDAFVNGAKSGRANSMDIREGPLSHNGTEYVHEGETALVGYGWAIYAKNTGSRVIIYNGWREWAKGKDGQSGHTTLQHLSSVESAAGPTMMYDHKQAQCSSPPETAKTMQPEYR